MRARHAPPEAPMPHGSAVWWWLCRLTHPFVGLSPEHRVEGLSRRDATTRLLDRAFGPEPVAEAGRHGLQMLTTFTILAGAVLGLIGGAVGAAVSALTDSPSAHWVVRASAILFSGPSLAVGSVWAVR